MTCGHCGKSSLSPARREPRKDRQPPRADLPFERNEGLEWGQPSAFVDRRRSGGVAPIAAFQAAMRSILFGPRDHVSLQEYVLSRLPMVSYSTTNYWPSVSMFDCWQGGSGLRPASSVAPSQAPRTEPRLTPLRFSASHAQHSRKPVSDRALLSTAS